METQLIQVVKYLAAALAGTTLFGVANSLSNAITSIANGIAKNPAVKDDLKGFSFVALAFIEICALLSFVIAILILMF